ncbi:MAG: AMP-binding protein, partial [Clostridia bacterium]|nr:AMP-binding protein [Clostridia bacterium]
MLERFLPRTEFDSYEDLKQNYKLNIPEGFNFAYDIVDEWARQDVNKPALFYCNDFGVRRMYSFEDMRRMSNRAANYFVSLGIKKGDTVLLMLKQRAEVWVVMLALFRIGAVCIPATYQLTKKDIVYRCNAAGVKMIVAAEDEHVIEAVNESAPECSALKHILLVGENIPQGWRDFRREYEIYSEEFARVPNKNSDIMLMYFSSGTTGMPKMIMHNFAYPLGHIITAKYWQHVEEGKLHLTMSDSGWAKFGWGKIFGQWICGAVVVAYDNEKFNAKNTLELIQEIKLTT